ncbi:MAG: hypothetical protein ACRDNE_01340 [Gaiellaceae bacterium]
MQTTFDEHPSLIGAGELKMFKEGIPSLAPGKQITTLFDNFPSRNEAGLGDSYRVTVEYRADFGDPLKEDLFLDLGLYRNRISVTRHDIHHVHARLKEIRDLFKTWTAKVGDGLLIVPPDERKRRTAEYLERAEGNEDEAPDESGTP